MHDEYQDAIHHKEILIRQQTEEIEHLRFQLNYYLNQRYGRKKDDVPDEQLILFDEPSEEEDKPEESFGTAVKAHTRTRVKPSLPKDTPVKTIAIEPNDEAKQCACGREKHRMGEEISERLEVFPLKYMLLKLVRGKYACRHCEDGVTIAPLPKSIMPKCQATPGALAHMMVSKYMDGLPLYRQATIFERMGLPWTRNLLCNWTMRCGEALKPLYQLMHQDLVRSHYAQVDETPVQVLQQPKGQSQRHFMWAYLGWVDDKPVVLYDYQPTHGGQAAVQFLEGFRGILQTDGYAAYNSVLNVTHANDWAHARRKFVEVIKHTKKPGIARKVVDAIKQLYAIEHQAKAQKLSPEERTKLRQQQAPPILKDMKVLLEKKWAQCHLNIP